MLEVVHNSGSIPESDKSFKAKNNKINESESVYIMAQTLNKAELVAIIAEQQVTTKKDAKAALESVVEAITGQLKEGNTISLVGFGKFYPVEVEERTAFSHLVGREVTTPAHTKYKAKLSKSL